MFNQFQKLNIFNTLSELFMFIIQHDLLQRAKEWSVLCNLRSVEENITPDEALSKTMREIMFVRLLGFFITIGCYGASLYYAVNENLVLIPSLLAAFPALVVVLSFFARKRVVKKFKEKGVILETYG